MGAPFFGCRCQNRGYNIAVILSFFLPCPSSLLSIYEDQRWRMWPLLISAQSKLAGGGDNLRSPLCQRRVKMFKEEDARIRILPPSLLETTKISFIHPPSSFTVMFPVGSLQRMSTSNSTSLKSGLFTDKLGIITFINRLF